MECVDLSKDYTVWLRRLLPKLTTHLVFNTVEYALRKTHGQALLHSQKHCTIFPPSSSKQTSNIKEKQSQHLHIQH